MHELLAARPNEAGPAYDRWLTDVGMIPKVTKKRYYDWKHECALTEQGTVDKALWGYKMMQSMEPEKYPLNFHELPADQQRAMKEGVLRIAKSIYIHGVSRDVVAAGSPMPQSFCFFVAGRCWA